MRDAVALVPGFIGFDHLGGWTYWADRFLAGLRGHLEAKRPGPIPVVPVPVPGIGSLAARQQALLDALHKLERANQGAYRWHLVGHSTGGVDAALLARTHALDETATRSVFSARELQTPTIGSITTLAAPHYGTCLALAPIAQRRWNCAKLGEAGRAALDVFARNDQSRWTRIKFALGAALEGSALKFLSDLVLNDRLARDLAPSVSADLTMEPNRREEIPIFCIATMAPKPVPRLPDKLFCDLWRFTQENAVGALPSPPAVSWSSAPVVVASRAQAGLLPTGPCDSDGVVNTDRQVYGGRNVRFAGLVIADHADVLGLYHRVDPVDPQQVIEPGLLTSGADFKDNEFFRMLELVAEGILANIP